MFPQHAVKYFSLYGYLSPEFNALMYYFNTQDPIPDNIKAPKLQKTPGTGRLEKRLVDKLFNKYPDLKYESISRQKYQEDNLNSYSYAYAFISEQKKLIKEGYTEKKSFSMVEEKFRRKM